MILDDLNWVTTKVVSHFLPRVMYLDTSNQEGYELFSNSYVLNADNLPETIINQDYMSVEVYQGFTEFPPQVLEAIFGQVVVGGTILLLNQPSVINHLSTLERNQMENSYTIKLIERNIFDVSDLWKAISRSDQEIFDRIGGQKYTKATDRFGTTTQLIMLTKSNNQEEIGASKKIFDTIWNKTMSIAPGIKRPASEDLHIPKKQKMTKECQHVKGKRSTEETEVAEDNVKEKKRSMEKNEVVEKPSNKRNKSVAVIDLTDDIEEVRPIMKDFQCEWLKFAQTCEAFQGFEIFEMIIGNSSAKARIKFEPQQLINKAIELKATEVPETDIAEVMEQVCTADAKELERYYSDFSNDNREKKRLFDDPPIWILENFLPDQELGWVLDSTLNHSDKFQKSFTEDANGLRQESLERTSTYLEPPKCSQVWESIKLKVCKIMGIERSFLFLN